MVNLRWLSLAPPRLCSIVGQISPIFPLVIPRPPPHSGETSIGWVGFSPDRVDEEAADPISGLDEAFSAAPLPPRCIAEQEGVDSAGSLTPLCGKRKRRAGEKLTGQRGRRRPLGRLPYFSRAERTLNVGERPGKFAGVRSSPASPSRLLDFFLKSSDVTYSTHYQLEKWLTH